MRLLAETAKTLKSLSEVLGLLGKDPQAAVADAKVRMLAGITLTEEEIAGLIAKRNQARATKNWAVSDEVRDLLLNHGIVLKDGPEGTIWQVK